MPDLKEKYFDWLLDTYILYDKFDSRRYYMRLLWFLFNYEFYWIDNFERDENRVEDALDLRRDFVEESLGMLYNEEFNTYFPVPNAIDSHRHDFKTYFPVSVLEVMVALAKRMESSIMWDPNEGDRTGDWFWRMIISLGLNGETDRVFDEEKAERIILNMLEHNYKPNGQGGLFTIEDSDIDMRDHELWYQMQFYSCYILDL